MTASFTIIVRSLLLCTEIALKMNVYTICFYIRSINDL